MESALNYSSREGGAMGLHVVHASLPNIRAERKGLIFAERSPGEMAKALYGIYVQWKENPELFEEKRKAIADEWRQAIRENNERLKARLHRFLKR